MSLGSALASGETPIYLGLDWLGAAGHLQIQVGADAVNIEKGNGVSNPYLQRELFVALRGVLQESAAYRKYFSAVANLKDLINLR